MFSGTTHYFDSAIFKSYPLAIEHSWLENPRTEWRFQLEITHFYGQFSICHVGLPEGNHFVLNMIHVYPVHRFTSEIAGVLFWQHFGESSDEDLAHGPQPLLMSD